MKRYLTAALLLVMSAMPSLAGDTFLAVEILHGTADLATEASTSFAGYAPAYDHSETGAKLEFWNLLSEDYAFNASFGFGYFGEENKPGANAAAGDAKATYSQSSWNIRVGGDRVLKLGERSYLFFGPGLEYWSGKAKFEDDTPPASSYETENVTRISLVGRMGVHMLIGETWGFTIQGGHKVGRASYEEAGAKTTWWPSSLDAAGGLVFRFGGY